MSDPAKSPPSLSELPPQEQAFTRSVLRVMLRVLARMKTDPHAHWRFPEIVQLLQTMAAECTPEAVTPVSAPPKPAQPAPESAEEGEEDLEVTRERCLAAGKTAFAEGVARRANPHGKGLNERKWWDIGWHDAERAEDLASGTGVVIQAGRRIEAQTEEKGFRVQCVDHSEITEWEEILHQYGKAGQGTVYATYDEALMVANRLQQAASGKMRVISTEDPVDKPSEG